MKKILALVSSLALFLSLVGCNTPASTSTASSSASSTVSSAASSEAATAAITQDRSGNAITLPEQVNRIVSLSPSTTRILLDLGLADKLVAVDTFSELPAGLEGNISRLDMLEPDLEQITSLEPDILFTTNMTAQGGDDKFKPLRADGLCVAEIPTATSIDAIWEDIRFIAGCAGADAEGDAIIKTAQDELAQLAELLKKSEERPTVLFEVSPAPYLYTGGSNTFLNEMITLAGGKNVFDTQPDYFPITEEAAIAAQPEFIITSDSFTPEPIASILARTGWETVPAIANEHVYLVDTNASSQPTQHIVEVVRAMMEYIHPELFTAK